MPPDVDVTKAYFKRAVHPKSDMSSPKQRTRIGVPLVNEAREPYQRQRAWIAPSKAAQTSSPTWATSSLAGASVNVEDGSSNWSSDITSTVSSTEASSVDPKAPPVLIPRVTFAHLRSEEFQQVLTEMRSEELREGRSGIAKAIEVAKAVAATTEFRLVCDQMRVDQERRARDGRETPPLSELMARYLNLAKPGPPIPPPPMLAPTYKPPPPLLATTYKLPPLKPFPPPLPLVPPNQHQS